MLMPGAAIAQGMDSDSPVAPRTARQASVPFGPVTFFFATGNQSEFAPSVSCVGTSPAHHDPGAGPPSASGDGLAP